MEGTLAPGEPVRLLPGGQCAGVVRKIAEGGMGEVYEVRVRGQSPLALKWYPPRQGADERRRHIEGLVRRGTPSTSFVWPQALVETEEGGRGFGYVMPLITEEYAGLVELMRGDVDATLRAMAAAGHQLAASFLLLHTQGLCYRDINFGNVVLDPATGDILICDNDHVGVDHGGDAGVAGTPRFMAPEIARGEALPSTQTDLYSLAVLLFYLLTSHHPLAGRRELEFPIWDAAGETSLFVTDPVFIFDPDDDRNRPIPGEHDSVLQNWEVLPGFVRDLFVQAFTDGLRDPTRRVGEMQWRDAMLRLRDLVFVCEHCPAEWFVDPADRSVSVGRPCWNCGAKNEMPLRLVLPRADVVLSDVTQLNPHHLRPDRPHDVSVVLAATVRRDDDHLLGLRNLSAERWIASMPGSSGAFLPPGRTIGLLEGVRIQFGAVEGEVVR